MGVFAKRNRLTKLGLDEISLVTAGDDPSAEVIIAKAENLEKTTDGGQLISTVSSISDQGASMPEEYEDTIDLSNTSPEVAAYIQALEDEVQRNDIVGEILEAIEEDGEYEDEYEDDRESVLSKADPAIRELIEKAEERAEVAEAIAFDERNIRIEREWIAKAATMPMITERPEELAIILKELDDADPELAEVITAILSAADRQIAKGNLFNEFGSSASTRLGGEVAAATSSIQKSDPSLTPEQAMVRAMELDDSLYNESL
ncbi:hypothetical protein UFOVP1279_48 [uncultured Caudovirales phage]|uniref:Uncharacterized protein n=1 Tax=uncultured Caudovirales phage TaxID=2100421 RepID=A0A6J5RLG9_9CAUD|nr:hypothetical protein UFOVP1279_48 [uncultured Caudovirales phage]